MTPHEKVDQINKFAYDHLMAQEVLAKGEREERYSLSLVYWKKFLINCKVISSLVAEGYHDEALTIQRLSMEHLFNMFALVTQENFVQELKNNTEASIPKALNCLNKDLSKDGGGLLTQENSQALTKALEKNENEPVCHLGYSVYNAAQASELWSFYNSIYRTLSVSYSHSTILSAIKPPGNEEVENMLDNAISFMEIAKAFVDKEFA
ncbi:hypothetical protein SAMN05216429_1095 [Marinobacter persicus]|uniref:Uncharacterized protein n=1 Tax=Marinobacter persicus TaxID=930118 RepID=A0A1I3W349_9GAMM|nr:DUF5677 domain-containing protein [Marinobacter persicus]GHD46668.1 hypothetical protein GCM10008110_13590 [Marinobacter persicus]SFK01870.1 hypothetical protein SAMN05216429_1095 [Marinobacter persicus]